MADPLLPWEPVRAAFGLPVTVAVEGEDPGEAAGVWCSPTTETFPAPHEGVGYRESPRVMALGRDEVPRCPRGTLVDAPETAGGEVLHWVVDGTERQEADHTRVYLVPAPDEDEES